MTKRHKPNTTRPIPFLVIRGRRKKGAINRRIVLAGSHDGRTIALHATKGWRSYRKVA